MTPEQFESFMNHVAPWAMVLIAFVLAVVLCIKFTFFDKPRPRITYRRWAQARRGSPSRIPKAEVARRIREKERVQRLAQTRRELEILKEYSPNDHWIETLEKKIIRLSKRR